MADQGTDDFFGDWTSTDTAGSTDDGGGTATQTDTGGWTDSKGETSTNTGGTSNEGGVWTDSDGGTPAGGGTSGGGAGWTDSKSGTTTETFGDYGPPGPTVGCDYIRLVDLMEVCENDMGELAFYPVAPRNQYINMPRYNGRPELGRTIRFAARIVWNSGDPSKSLAGQTVCWFYLPQGCKIPLMPELQAGFGSPGTPTTTSSTREDGWTDIVEFYPSQCGGDAFTVCATLPYTPAGLSAGPYTVWRWLFYDVDSMQRSDGTSWAEGVEDLPQAMELLYSRFNILMSRVGTDSHPYWVRQFLNVPGETRFDAYAAGCRDGYGSPRYVHLLFIDSIFRGPTVVTSSLWMNVGMNGLVYDGEHYHFDLADWFDQASFWQDGYYGPLPAARFQMQEIGDPRSGDDRYLVGVNVSDLLNPSRPYWLSLTVKTYAEEDRGMRTNDAAMVGMRVLLRRYHQDRAMYGKLAFKAVIHEVAHTMGLGYPQLPDGTANPAWFDQPSPHCATMPGCVMFCEVTEITGESFCPECEKILRARNLTSLPYIAGSPY